MLIFTVSHKINLLKIIKKFTFIDNIVEIFPSAVRKTNNTQILKSVLPYNRFLF